MDRKAFGRSTGVATIMIAGVLGIAPLSAQETGGQETARSSASTGDVILVTARKRVEDVQKVSESITVVNGEALERLQIVQPSDLTRISPALTFRDNPIPTSSAFAIRGIGTSSFSSTVEQSVSTVVDGVVLGQPQSAAALIDIERIEVLAGPQGLLFGKNASAGLVNIVTNSPRLGRFATEMSVTVGTDGEFRNSGVVNVPIGDELAVRLVGFRNRADGFIHNEFLNEDYNGERNYGFRGKLLFEPSDAVRVLVTGDYSKDTATCCFSTALTLGDNANLANYFEEYGIEPGPDNLSVVAGMPTGTYPGAPLRRYKGLAGQVDIDLGGMALTSITG